MVEFKDATDAERAVDLCNSGLLAVRSTDLFGLLDRVGNSDAAGEYYLPVIVMLDAADGRRRAVVANGADDAEGVNSTEDARRWKRAVRRMSTGGTTW